MSSSHSTYLTEHPEGYLRRIDGTLLRLYPATSLLTPLTPEESTETPELFRQSVPLLWRHRERILSDSQMFLTPIAERNGLAYLGPSPQRHWVRILSSGCCAMQRSSQTSEGSSTL